MLNCVPQEIVVTANFLFHLSNFTDTWNKFFNKHPQVYVHFPTLLNMLKDRKLTGMDIRLITDAWEDNKVIPIPHGDDVAELPAIVSMDMAHPDNVRVYCYTFGEYVELRKNFSREDIGGF